MNKQFYNLHEQIISTSDKIKQTEIEDFINKYGLDSKRSQSEPKAKPIMEFFVVLIIMNTIIGIVYWNFENLLMGYLTISILFMLSVIFAKFRRFNIKVN